ncbi:hypothetical protein SAMD00019534_056840, partial [Acytostelium subglobosum LB1]|uniref:hypothetical protein n=1 Tax=Acytostelium subglobosum LB1 TaxID=1410327 RepID=UPI000644BC10
MRLIGQVLIQDHFHHGMMTPSLVYSFIGEYSLYLADKASGTPPLSNEYITTHMIPMMQDLVTRYEPAVIWSDGDWEQLSTYWQSTEFLAWLYTNSTVKDEVVTNDRWGSECRGINGGYYTPADEYNPGKLLPHKWENCYTMGWSWGYYDNQPLLAFQTATQLLTELVSTVSCGGNMLLNIGPTPEGTIPWIMQERLQEIGNWLKINGEAIYSSKPWRAQNDTASQVVWYTMNPTTNVVYAISLYWPTDGVLTLAQPLSTTSTTVNLIGCEPASLCQSLSFQGSTSALGMNIKLPQLTDPTQYPPSGLYVFELHNVK